MTKVNLTSTTGSGFLETDFDQIKDLLQDGGVEGVTITASALVTTAGINVDTLASSTTTNTSAISLNTTHRSSNGSDHGYIDQDVTSGSSPTFDGSNITSVSVVASNVSIADADSEFNATEVESALKEIVVKTDKNGFDRYDTNSMPDVAYSARTITLSVKSGQSSFHFWTNNKKVTKTSDQTVTIPDTTGSYYIYFDDSGVLQYILQDSVPDTAFYKFAIAAFVYYNKDHTTEYLFNTDELHGKDMSGVTHQSLHNTFGAQYSDGLDIEGLADGDATYTQSTSGTIYDEDIKHDLASNSSGHPFLYRDGSSGAWRKTSASLAVARTEGGSYYVWNENTSGTTWQLTEGTSSTDFWMTFFVATPIGIMKIIGQNAYSSVRKARNAIETEVDNLKTDGLPNPEFVFLGAIIVKRDGELQEMADGSVFYPLKTSGRSSAGAGSGTTSYAADVPTDTTDFDTHLSSTDTDVQTALDTLDDHTHTASQITDFDTEVSNNASVTANTAKVSYPGSADATELNILDGATLTTTELNYVDGVTSAIQTQLDAKEGLSLSIATKTSAYTLASSDNGTVLHVTGTTTITMPNSLSTGFNVVISNTGTDTVTLSATTTLNTKDDNADIADQYGAVSAYYAGGSTWYAYGDLS